MTRAGLLTPQQLSFYHTYSRSSLRHKRRDSVFFPFIFWGGRSTYHLLCNNTHTPLCWRSVLFRSLSHRLFFGALIFVYIINIYIRRRSVLYWSHPRDFHVLRRRDFCNARGAGSCVLYFETIAVLWRAVKKWCVCESVTL